MKILIHFTQWELLNIGWCPLIALETWPSKKLVMFPEVCWFNAPSPKKRNYWTEGFSPLIGTICLVIVHINLRRYCRTPESCTRERGDSCQSPIPVYHFREPPHTIIPPYYVMFLLQLYFHILKLTYKDVCRKTIKNQDHTCIIEAHYYLTVCNVHFKVASMYLVKKKFSLIQFCHCTLKSTWQRLGSLKVWCSPS